MKYEVIVAENLVKEYVTRKRKGLFRGERKIVKALKGVSFKIYEGEVVGLLGPNGAGKTTTVKIIATLLIPDSGDAWVLGHHVVKEPNFVRKHLGVMLTVEKGFYGKLTGRENLEYFGALYGLKGAKLKERVNYLLKLLELDRLEAADRLFEEYSLGMKARLNLARALLRDPPVLLLDEPTLGLDPPSARRIRNLVKDLAHREGKTVLYTTHNMFEAEIVCDRILLINKGTIIAEGTPEKLKSIIPEIKTVNITVRGVRDPKEVLEKMDVRKYSISPSNGLYNVRIYAYKPEEIIGELVRKLVNEGFDIISLNIEEPTLEDVFIYFTKEGAKY